ncbi:50S ribosomal protein L32, partial [bacterium]|nr:50S ribosomal protein L32 [bacterium]
PNLVACEQCKQPKLMHHICKNCGSYKGEEIINVNENK